MTYHQELYDKGWMPIPAHIFLDHTNPHKRHKKPLVNWKQYNRDPSTYHPKDVFGHFGKDPSVGVGIVTGIQRDGTRVVVVDIDPPENPDFPTHIPSELIEASLNTMTTTTPSGGRHLYFKYEGPLTLKNKTNLFKVNKETDTVIDLRAQGGFSVMGPSSLWVWDWKERSDDKGHRRTAPLHPSEDHSPYVTQDYISPSQLAQLPEFIITAFKKHEEQRLDYEAPSHEVKKQWENVLNQTTPDASKGESLHGTMLSWSMRLVATYIKDVHTPQDAQALYGRFITDIAPLVQERNADPNKRKITEAEVSKIFYTALDKIRNKRSATYRLAKHLIDPVLSQHVSEYESSLWDNLQVTQIINYSTHLYATNDDHSKGFELAPAQLTKQQDWRTQHFINFGTLLPKIKTASFESILSSLPIHTPPPSASGTTPETLSKLILDDWLTGGKGIDEGEELTPQTAITTAKSTGRCTHNDVLYFKLNTLQSALRSQGLGSIPLTRLSQVLTSINVTPTDTATIWKYE